MNANDSLLLDTHVFLRLAGEPKRVPAWARAVIDDAESVALSIVSAWEIAIKSSLGKLPGITRAPDFVRSTMSGLRMTLLPITTEHTSLAASLPLHHRDPFDRLLIAQAMQERLTLVTFDKAIAPYDVTLLRRSRA